MKITNTFVGGKMNMDIDQRLLPKGQYFKAMNIEVINPESNGTGSDDYGDSGVLRNSIGNLRPVSGANVALEVKSISGGALVNARCIGACVNNQSNSIYWLITSDNEDLIVEYLDTPNVIPTLGTAGTAGAISYIARAVKGVGAVAGKYFNFNINYPVTGINYFNGFLLWTDNLNPPRMINVNTFKAWTMPAVNFTWNQDDINVIVKPPLASPTIELLNDGTGINYMLDKFLYFSYRYKYTDGRWSSIAPFSRVAFEPSVFSYNAYTGYNAGMENRFNNVNITVATGARQVTDIQFLFKDSSQPNIYIIETINKSKPIIGTSSIPSDATWTYIKFDNHKTFASLPSSQLTRLFDNVPIRALSQDIIGSRLVYGNYTQYYDMVNGYGSSLIPNFTVKKYISPILSYKVEPSLKSNRTYELGLIYLDDYGRMSTIITSPTNTCRIDTTASNSGVAPLLKNSISLQVFHNPPNWATKYRVAIKQTQNKYYNIYPTAIVRGTDGSYSYYLLNNSDKDKIIEGDFVVIKSDFDGITYSSNQYRVLEISFKAANAIAANSKEGLYLKIAYTSTNITPSINTYQSINTIGQLSILSSSNTFPFSSWLNWNTPANLIGQDFSPIIYYPYGGIGSSLTGAQAYFYTTLAFPKDYRFYIEYAGIISGFHTVNYKLLNSSGAIINASPLPFRNATTNAAVNIPIKISPTSSVYGQLFISPSVTVNTYDSFRLNVYSKNTNGKTVGGNAISPLGIAFEPNLTDPVIYPGMIVSIGAIHENIRYNLSTPWPNSVTIVNMPTTPAQNFISNNKYVDIQEWFWESGAYNSFAHLSSTQQNVGYRNVFFRWGLSSVQYNVTNSTIYSTSTSVNVTTFNNGLRVYMIIGTPNNQPAVNPPNTISGYREMYISSALNSTNPATGFCTQYQKNILSLETVPRVDPNEVFHECTEDLFLYENTLSQKKHYGYPNVSQNAQTNTLPAVIYLKQDLLSTHNGSFNCWAFPNGVESDRIRDDFNAPTTEWSPRVSIPIDDYSQQVVSEGLTYSGVYKQDSNVNNLNQFNISLGNFKYLDKSFGSVQKIKSRNTDLVVFQQDKVSKVLFGKNLLSDSVGGGQIASIPEVLGTQIAYQGEFGISNNPESFAQWDDNMFFTDSQRGAVLRLGNDGLFEISSNGMKSFFNTNFKSQPDTLKIGVFDPYYKRYILSETGFNKSQSLPSTTVVNNPLDTVGQTFPATNNEIVIIPASGNS